MNGNKISLILYSNIPAVFGRNKYNNNTGSHKGRDEVNYIAL